MCVGKREFFEMAKPFRFPFQTDQASTSPWTLVDFVNDGFNGMEHAVIVLQGKVSEKAKLTHID